MTPSLGHALLLLAAGLGAGVCGTVAGLASLSSYPALLAIGLSPVAANATNTVALLGNTAGSVAGSRPELVGQRAWLVRRLPIMLVGGLAGGILLLTTPQGSFAYVVPFLVGFASLLIVVRPRIQRYLATHRPEAPRRGAALGTSAGLFTTGLYGGYFGAGAGVMVLALLLLTGTDSVVRSNAAKNVLLGAANGAAAVVFAFFGPVHWLDALPLACGCVGGGWLGPKIARVLPPTLLQWVIALAGLYLAVELGRDAWG